VHTRPEASPKAGGARSPQLVTFTAPTVHGVLKHASISANIQQAGRQAGRQAARSAGGAPQTTWEGRGDALNHCTPTLPSHSGVDLSDRASRAVPVQI